MQIRFWQNAAFLFFLNLQVSDS